MPLYLLRLLLARSGRAALREAIGERFGHYRDAASAGWLWIHAVSLGETRAAAPLIEALRAAPPGLRLLLTHGTATGRAAGRSCCATATARPGCRTTRRAAVRRFLAHFAPVGGVLMETEVWPNLLAAAKARGRADGPRQCAPERAQPAPRRDASTP